jgi:hypothetical protein
LATTLVLLASAAPAAAVLLCAQTPEVRIQPYLAGIRVRLGGKRARTGKRGRATVTRRFVDRGRYRAIARLKGLKRDSVRIHATD